MTYNLYCVRDKHAGFGAIITDSSDSIASRNFAYGCQNGLTAFAVEDFDLYCVGTLDSESGSVTPCVPRMIISGVNAKELYKVER